MICTHCLSAHERELYAEINIHSQGLDNIDDPGLLDHVPQQGPGEMPGFQPVPGGEGDVDGVLRQGFQIVEAELQGVLGMAADGDARGGIRCRTGSGRDAEAQ